MHFRPRRHHHIFVSKREGWQLDRVSQMKWDTSLAVGTSKGQGVFNAASLSLLSLSLASSNLTQTTSQPARPTRAPLRLRRPTDVINLFAASLRTRRFALNKTERTQGVFADATYKVFFFWKKTKYGETTLN